MTDVLIVTPPYSPHDTSPPLGPAVLAAHIESTGLSCRHLDLNIRFLRLFEGDDGAATTLVGDHSKDRRRVVRSRRFFASRLHVPAPHPVIVPDGVDPVVSLPHRFEQLHTALEAMRSDPFWREFVGQALHGVAGQPRVLGLSIMGPAQVLPAVLTATLARELWPGLTVVAGGSHITLLANEIADDARYAMAVFDVFLPHHSEQAFTAVCRRVVDGRPWRSVPGVVVAGRGQRVPPPMAEEWLPPKFDLGDLDLYGSPVSVPLQLERGCGYGRCTFCTYPLVERVSVTLGATTLERHVRAAVAVGAEQVTVKDSLMSMKSMRAFGRLVTSVAPDMGWSATTKVIPGLATHARELADHGCATIEFGIETIHSRLQRLIDKAQSVPVVENVVRACADVGIHVVLNMLYGLPGETLAEAQAQLTWFEELVRRHPGLVHGSHNLVEVNRASPFATRPSDFGIELGPTGPWAFSYCWDAPRWRAKFKSELDRRTDRARREIQEAA